jgi:hypothetical protein
MDLLLFFVVLGFELRALSLLGRCYTDFPTLSPLFSGYFGDKFLFFFQVSEL